MQSKSVPQGKPLVRTALRLPLFGVGGNSPPVLLHGRALEDIIDPFYGDDVPRQQGGAWRQSFQDLEKSRLVMNEPPHPPCAKSTSSAGEVVDGAATIYARNGTSDDCRYFILTVELSVRSRNNGDAGSEGKLRRSFFGELTEQHFKHSQMLTLDELDDRMRSISVIATRCVCVRTW